MSQQTRLGLYGGPRPVYGSFSGKVESNDIVPDQFTFTDVIDQGHGEVISSNTITLSGTDIPTNATFTESGHLSGEYSLNGGAWTDLATVSVSSTDTLQLRLTSSATKDSPHSITVTIGGVSDTWDVTTAHNVGTAITNSGASTDVPSNYEVDDRTGFRLEPHEVVVDWYGQRTNKKSADSRHPQEMVRSRSDKFPGSISPEQDDRFLADNEVTTDDL